MLGRPPRRPRRLGGERHGGEWLGGGGSAAGGSAPGDAAASGPASAGGADVVVGQDNPNAAIEPMSSVVSTAIAPGTNGQRVILVKAVGKVTGTPDTVTIAIGVQTTASTAGAALDENNAKANAVIAVLKGKGVAVPTCRPADCRSARRTPTAATRSPAIR